LRSDGTLTEARARVK